MQCHFLKTESLPSRLTVDSCLPAAVLGPPDVSVSGCGNCLLLQLTAPTGLQQLRDLYRGLVLHVQRTRDGAQVCVRLKAASISQALAPPTVQPWPRFGVAASMMTSQAGLWL